MHELSLIQNLFEILEKEIKIKNQSQLHKITLEIGKFSNVETLLLKECFDVLKNGTIFKNSELIIEEVKTKVKCLKCKKIFEPESFPFLCPYCESSGGKILKGEGIFLKKIEII